LNRIDDVVIFNTLEKEDIFKIIDITLKDLLDRMKNMGYTLELNKKAKEFVAEKGFDPQFGARPLNRAVQKYVEDPLADYILRNNPESGSVLEAKLSKDSTIVISEKKKTEPKS